jgi:hypothetical protein
MPTEISIRQNSSQAILLLKAIAVLHQRSQWVQSGSLAASALLAGSAVVAIWMEKASQLIPLMGTMWATVYVMAIMPISQRSMQKTAVLQEMFDVEVFNLEWNPVAAGPRFSMAEVVRLSDKFKGSERWLRDYYVTSPEAYPRDVFFCMQQNLEWGPLVRRRYARTVMLIGITWSAGGVALGFVERLTVNDLINSWFAPSLGLLILCLEVYQSQMADIRERGRLLTVLLSVPERQSLTKQLLVLRQIQDVVLQLRRQYPRTPPWFFHWFHSKDRFNYQRLSSKSP